MTSKPTPVHPRRAFTLIEMLTVLGILAILIAVIIPAMNIARRTAKNADTRVTLTQIGNACSSFQNDQKRLPGYFSPRVMGAPANGTLAGTGRGFTTMENIMLDLMGGVAADQSSPPTGSIRVGPGTIQPGNPGATQVYVDVTQMGSTTQSKTGTESRSYMPMDSKRFVPQGSVAGVITDPSKRMAESATDDSYKFPTIVDPFGQPILAWAQDDIPSVNNVFAANDSTAAQPNGARFYWAQNAGFLCAPSLGKQGENQAYNSTQKTGSVIGKNATGANATASLAALLGNPSNPDPNSITGPSANPVPLTARGQIILHSAGADGVYMGAQDKGGRSGMVQYRPNQDPMGGVLFDDIIATGGN